MSFSLFHSHDGGFLEMRKTDIHNSIIPRSLGNYFRLRLKNCWDRSFQVSANYQERGCAIASAGQVQVRSAVNADELSKSDTRINGGDSYSGPDHRVYKAVAINTAHHQSCFGRSKPTKSTQEWHSRWVKDRKHWGFSKSIRLCLKSILY